MYSDVKSDIFVGTIPARLHYQYALALSLMHKIFASTNFLQRFQLPTCEVERNAIRTMHERDVIRTKFLQSTHTEPISQHSKGC